MWLQMPCAGRIDYAEVLVKTSLGNALNIFFSLQLVPHTRNKNPKFI